MSFALFAVSALITLGGVPVFVEKLDLGTALRTLRDMSLGLPLSDEVLRDVGRFLGVILAVMGLGLCVTIATGSY